MKIGDLNRRITLQQKTRVSDSMGGFIETWTDVATIWAAIWPTSASEAIQAAQMVMTISHRIRIRYRSVLKSSWRVKYGNHYYAVVSIINPNMSNEYLDLMCKEAA